MHCCCCCWPLAPDSRRRHCVHLTPSPQRLSPPVSLTLDKRSHSNSTVHIICSIILLLLAFSQNLHTVCLSATFAQPLLPFQLVAFFLSCCQFIPLGTVLSEWHHLRTMAISSTLSERLFPICRVTWALLLLITISLR